MSLIANERIKLRASFFNSAAAAMVGAGFIVPLVAFTYGIPGAAPGFTLMLAGAAWLAGGWCLHLLAMRLLRGLKE